MEPEPVNSTLSAAAVAALQRGNKIEAIKLVRTDRGIDLKAAKDAVEAYLRTQPSLQDTFTAAQTQTKRGALLWLIVLIAGAVLLYLLAGR